MNSRHVVDEYIHVLIVSNALQLVLVMTGYAESDQYIQKLWVNLKARSTASKSSLSYDMNSFQNTIAVSPCVE